MNINKKIHKVVKRQILYLQVPSDSHNKEKWLVRETLSSKVKAKNKFTELKALNNLKEQNA